MERPQAKRAFNRLIRPKVFSGAMALAWLKHNVEEVGNLGLFPPNLFHDLAVGSNAWSKQDALIALGFA